MTRSPLILPRSSAINGIGIRRCLDALNGRALSKIIFVSTFSNYGLMKHGRLADESSPLQPLSLYAKAKVEAEQHLLEMKGSADFCRSNSSFRYSLWRCASYEIRPHRQ